MADGQAQIERLRKRFNASPDSRAFAPLADFLRQEGQTEEALVLLEDGLARHPDSLSAMVILGHTLLDANRRDHGRKVLVRVLDLDPENFVALGLLVDDAVGQELWHLAVPWLEKLVAVEPNEARWGELLGLGRMQLSAERPKAPLSLAAAQNADGFATMTMVDIYMEQGYLKKALAALRLMQAQDPRRPDVRDKLGKVLALLDDGGEYGGGVSGGATTPEVNRPPTKVSQRERQASKRSRDKQKFQDWVDGIQPESDRPS